VTLDHATAARMLPLPASCGLQKHIKASTHKAFKFCIQYAEYARKYAEYVRKYARI
jgi:hypothetical protein